jgi:hypothetical protein
MVASCFGSTAWTSRRPSRRRGGSAHGRARDRDRPVEASLDEPETGHNRRHEAIEPVVEVEPGDTVVYETRDAFDWQLQLGATAEQLLTARLGLVHPLTGSGFVKGAEAGRPPRG